MCQLALNFFTNNFFNFINNFKIIIAGLKSGNKPESERVTTNHKEDSHWYFAENSKKVQKFSTWNAGNFENISNNLEKTRKKYDFSNILATMKVVK